jgi:hypothetical protein
MAWAARLCTPQISAAGRGAPSARRPQATIPQQLEPCELLQTLDRRETETRCNHRVPFLLNRLTCNQSSMRLGQLLLGLSQGGRGYLPIARKHHSI